ncbi:DsbA family protein [Hippea alviniae]|uniref:DsbA family protein n=1 Tax=Hippea alviniae TaxID=1279027 RepID=UPI0003B361D5|nr:thioredoxin fold domain-containing protein [Hippea alviniae]
MRAKLLIAGLSIAFMSSTAFASKTPYDEILKKMIPPNINYTVKVEKNSKIKGFNQLNVAIENKKFGVIVHRYLWISKDKKEIIPVLLTYENGKLKRIEPKKQIERVKVDLKWLKELLKELPESAKKSYGKGTDVYMFSDPLCPFCKRQLPQLVKLAEEGKIKLHILPFDVHGKKANEASAIFLDIEKKEGLKAAIDKVESASFKDVENIIKNTKNLKELKKKYSPIIDKIAKAAIQHGINGTPATVVMYSDGKGYMLMGLSNVDKFIKKK